MSTFALSFDEGKRFETQTRLAQRAIQNQTFSRLHQLLRWNIFIDLSITRVLRNSGSKTPGVDGKTRNDYATVEQKQELRNKVKETLRHYMSSPVRRIYIPKPHKPNEKRPLGIPTLVDRVAQDVVRCILEPIYESKQHPHSYGFRPFRCTHHAIERVRFLIGQKHPYVREEREELDKDKKLNELLKVHKKRFLERLFGRDNWYSFRTDVVKKQKGLCAHCNRKLVRPNTHVYFQDHHSHFKHPEDQWNDFLIALCIPCHKKRLKELG